MPAKSKTSINWTKSRAYRELKSGLEANLEARGLVEPMYSDMLKHYLDLWLQFQSLQADITERGVTVWDAKRGMMVENRSVSLEIQVSRQMLNIYTALGFKDVSASGGKSEMFDYGEL